jgi:excisionase family DNA binding protein
MTAIPADPIPLSEAARLLGVGTSTAYRWGEQGRFLCWRLGGKKWVASRASVLAMWQPVLAKKLDLHSCTSSPAVPAGAQERLKGLGYPESAEARSLAP